MFLSSPPSSSFNIFSSSDLIHAQILNYYMNNYNKNLSSAYYVAGTVLMISNSYDKIKDRGFKAILKQRKGRQEKLRALKGSRS